MAVGPKWNQAVRVYRDGNTDGEPVLQGIGSAVWERIAALASDGTTLVLKEAE
jgi:hypothetical protein